MNHTKKSSLLDATNQAELNRLSALSPLFSPIAGWPELKGLQFARVGLDVQLNTSDFPELADAAPETLRSEPALRLKVAKATRELISGVLSLAKQSLKPAGWKLTKLDQATPHILASLWTRKGQSVAILAYSEDTLPSRVWRNTNLGSGRAFKLPKEPNAIASHIRVFIAADKSSSKGLTEVANALADQLAAINRHKEKVLGNYRLNETGDRGRWRGGIPQVHLCQDPESTLHRDLIRELRGRVTFVNYQPNEGCNPMFTTLGTAPRKEWDVAPIDKVFNLFPGSIRLVALDQQGHMIWAEQYDPSQPVPRASIKRLLASAKPWAFAPWFEMQALQRSAQLA
jgi:hypothetical protein